MKISRRKLLAAVMIGSSLCAAPIWAGTDKNTGVTEKKSGAESAPTPIASANGPVKLSDSAVRVPLIPAADAGVEKDWLAKRLNTSESGRRFHLILRDLTVAEQPGVIFHVYFDLPPGTAPREHDPHYAGTVNFFNARKPGAPESREYARKRFHSYDVTAMLRKLHAGGQLSDLTTVTIIPAGVPAADATAAIGEIELVEH